MDVILGGKSISSATNTYAHRSILEVLLNYDKQAAESQSGGGLFCKDTAGQMEEMDISADPVLNTGLGTKSEWTKKSKTVELLSSWAPYYRQRRSSSLLQFSMPSTQFSMTKMHSMPL